MTERQNEAALDNSSSRPILGTILLVDDEEIIRQLGTRILERSGYRVITARDGAEGIMTYRKYSHEIDITILDISMPEMDGIETMHRLRGEFPDAKILISTGQTVENNFNHIDDEETCDILMKPYRAEELTAKIREAIARSK